MTETLTETKEKTALGTPWNVVVHNDPINSTTYVTMVFKRVFGFSTQKATQHMLEVHERGRSILWTGERERAEFYTQQLQSYLLLTTIEKAA